MAAKGMMIGCIGEFCEGKEEFESYLERLEQWMAVNGIVEGKDSDDRVSALLAIIGPQTYSLLKNLLTPEKPSEQDFKTITETLKSHDKLKHIIVAERFRFKKRTQKEGESIADYIVAIKQLSATCEFGGFLEEALRDQFVCGLHQEAIQKKLLAVRDLNFNKACDIALAMEMAAKNTLELSGKPEQGTSAEVHKVTGKSNNVKKN